VYLFIDDILPHSINAERILQCHCAAAEGARTKLSKSPQSKMSTKPPPTLEEIFNPNTLQYAEDIAFPFDLDKPLNATTVARHFFNHQQQQQDWNDVKIHRALILLSRIGWDNINLDDFSNFVRHSSSDGGDGRLRFLGVILILGHGARRVCKGEDARYIFQFFEPICLHMINSILGDGGNVNISDWEAAGIDKDHAILRMVLLIAPLGLSERLEDRERFQRILERMRTQYERLTHTKDPHRATYERDTNDVDVLAKMIQDGPPMGEGVHMPDLVYWLMRYSSAPMAVTRKFGRSPIRNVAIGRDDAEGEVDFLNKIGVGRTEGDEMVRQKIKADIAAGRWEPLELW
jgi:hypothetical protein